ncbi:hypothetical protein FCV25MIE_29452 [Fagus crenata]
MGDYGSATTQNNDYSSRELDETKKAIWYTPSPPPPKGVSGQVADPRTSPPCGHNEDTTPPTTVVSIEVEQSEGGKNQTHISPLNDADFEEQLRVINNAINFGPTSNNSKENISTPFMLPTPINQPNMESFHPHAADSTRAVFRDITNVTPDFKPKISNGGAKWKRLARAQSAPHSDLVAPLPLKHNNPSD